MNAALERWRRALPPGRVRSAAAELAAAGAATLAWPCRVDAILAPEDVEQVRAVMRIAAETRQPVYPIGRGCNWGLGSKLPPSDGCVLLDLSGMNRIVDHDAELGTLTVEPGVHFAQAAAYLTQRRSGYYCSVTGGPPYGSLIGNALERGGGDGPLGDRAAQMTALQVVLAGGEVVHTGFERYGATSTARLSRTGVGPSLTELMAQSNFGVVTRATFWLAQRPAGWQLLNASLASAEALGPAIDALRALIQGQVLYANALTLWNRHKLQAREGRYSGIRPAAGDVAPWSLSLSVEAANAAIGDALMDEVRRQLAPHLHDAEVLRDSTLNDAERRLLEPGNPTGVNLVSAYWRKTMPLPALEDIDPDRDRCGVIWLCPSLPLLGRVAAPVIAGIERRVLAHGFEPNIGLNPASSRLLDVYVALMYDRDIAGEDERAMACHHALMRWLTDAGHLPYRLGVQSFGLLPRPVDDSAAVLRRIKQAFDPHGVVAPGRYAV